MPVHEKLLSGLWYMNGQIEGGLNGRKLSNRITEIGAKRLLDGATRAQAFYIRGGPKVFADGMLQEINKGLHNKFTFASKDQA